MSHPEGRTGGRVRRAEAVCDRFEAAWAAGGRPRAEGELAAVPAAERPGLLRELVLLEIDYRRLAGDGPRADEFLARFPDLDRGWVERALAEPAPTQPLALADTVAPSRVVPSAGGPSGAADLRRLLHKRLRFIGLAVLVFFTYFVGLGLIFHFDLFVRYRDYAAPYVLLVLVTGVLEVVLWAGRPLSLRQLRGIELTIFGLLLGALGWKLGCDLFLRPPFHGQAEWANTSDRDTYFLLLHVGYESLAFSILIIGYATLIPSHWARCTLVVGVMAATPVAISAAACVETAVSPPTFLWGYVLPMAIYLGMAVAVAAFGTHRIGLLREEAARARRLGPYRLTRRLGAGGMGEVYLAEHVLLKRPCAVKLIRPERVGDPAAVRRFEREVRATARLEHWNTVEVYDFGQAPDGTLYYVMEYLPGRTLEELVKREGAVPAGRAVRLLRQVGLALREAHALGLVHRDLKPANIMVGDRGGERDVVKVLDFGLVKAVGPAPQSGTLTGEGVVAGTPAYMSPEQAAGLDHLDGRSDIYSLGATAYYLLTGRPPFHYITAVQLLAAHLHEPVVPLTEVRPDVPADLAAVVLRCLEKDPARRFPDAAGLLDALAGCAAAGPAG